MERGKIGELGEQEPVSEDEKLKEFDRLQRVAAASGGKKIENPKMTELIVLPLDLLQKQVCSECLKYLTVLPITVSKNGDIFCGRHKNHDSRVTSLMNNVIKNYTFKCINHFEGCEENLNTSTSRQHEQECEFEPHECIFCSFKGNWCQIMGHSMKEHPLNVTSDCKFNFKIGTESSKKILYPVNYTIYLFDVDISFEKFSVAISAIARNDFRVNQCALKFGHYPYCENDENGLVDYGYFDSRSKNYFQKDIEELIFHFGVDTMLSCQVLLKPVELSDKALELEKRFAQYNEHLQALVEREKSLKKTTKIITAQKQTLEGLSNLFKKLSVTHFKCSNCNKNVINAIYFCPQNHCYCKNCLSSHCKVCNDMCEFTNILEFDKIQVACDWPRCKKSVRLSNYLDHTSNCLHRPYKCPISKCLEVIYSCQELVNHWHHYGALIKKEVLEFDEYGNYDCYWLIQADLYHVIVKFIQGSIQIVIEDINVLLKSVDKFKIEGNYKPNYNWDILQQMSLSGKYIVICNNCHSSGYYYTKVKISIGVK